MVFITGLLAPAVLRGFDKLALRYKLTVTGAGLVAAAGVFLDANWKFMGLAASPVQALFHNLLVYDKIPLSFGEYLRYMTLMGVIILSTAVVWRYIAASRIVSLFTLLGRNSLMIYVAHLFLQEVIVAFVYRYHPDSTWWALSAPLAVAVLALLAWLVEWRRKTRRTARATAATPAQLGQSMPMVSEAI
jgi:fucose 4-O-acetylase-like acetyltransferase